MSRNIRSNESFELLTPKESWSEYAARVGPFKNPAHEHFAHHVLFEHTTMPFRFSEIILANFSCKFVTATASWIEENIRYDGEELSDWWEDQLDQSPTFTLVEAMRSLSTWPIEPVILDFGDDSRLWSYGVRYNLIEGTHRISYLCGLMRRGEYHPESVHRIVTVSP